ncbi:DUF4383 domain-containing protein [Actinocrispum wychmicini]|uniref:Uncharacterized protein DUF4383 n=1 Tax=Actinocrispum wychmicini TaxID=1213861 RepID=A0A4R2ILH5_9PSEU|nr:DUF4383 domain-containing protein [Actinocrispum wychmicini]TCO45362.1 uncharacterized protein DUF4383 [Actinocrispum wychmicini]
MAHASTVHATQVRAAFQPVQVIAFVVGAGYLVAGVLGFVRTGVSDWSPDNLHSLAGFMVNPWHNLVHVAVGGIGLLCAFRPATARMFGWLLVIAFGAFCLWGLAVSGAFATNPVAGMGNPFALDVADNWLHFGTAVVGLLIAVLPARRKVVVETPEPVEPESTVEPVGGRPPADHDDV